jgi:hypothetical protein
MGYTDERGASGRRQTQTPDINGFASALLTASLTQISAFFCTILHNFAQFCIFLHFSAQLCIQSCADSPQVIDRMAISQCTGAISLIKKEKTGIFRPRGAGFGLAHRFSVRLRHLSGQPRRFQVNFNVWRKSGGSNPRLFRRLTAPVRLTPLFTRSP